MLITTHTSGDVATKI